MVRRSQAQTELWDTRDSSSFDRKGETERKPGWWFIPATPVLGRQRQEDQELMASLGYKTIPF